MSHPVSIDRRRLAAATEAEKARFEKDHPRSRALFERARGSLLGGVPMNWMVRWPGAFPIFVREGKGPRFTDVDGREHVDFCLGDTGAMTGHAPAAAVEAVAARMRAGATFMLPTEDAIFVGEELTRRFGLPSWQMALTATDANRFAIRLARHITGRPKILVYNGCYHGTVDETFIALEDGRARARSGNIGPPVDPTVTTKVIEFNDVAALEAALQPGDVACVLAEPAMTNIGIVLPEPGYHAALRDVTRRTGTLLIIDETHTICCGTGGYTRAHGLEPDMLTIGKPIASGVPAAVYGVSEELARRIVPLIRSEESDAGGIGGTLAGNALSLAAMRATLESVLTEDAFARTIPLARRWAAGVAQAISDAGLPWHVTDLGCRAEYWFSDHPPKNGGEAGRGIDHDLDLYMHLAALNRGILMTPFHNMALIAPGTTEADVDAHTRAFKESVAAIIA
jgi:glutamate-1-semialdehyde 2,1-aminomutase